MVGAHAAFTCSDETLEAASDLAKKHKTGVHIHVAEGPDDSHAGARLENLSKDNWLLIHAVHLDRKLSGYIVHNPRSNMNNSVGYAKPSTLTNKVLIGTDGIGADMLEEARLAYVRLREFEITESPTTVWSWIENSYELFPEAKNDRVTFDYDHVDSPWHVAFTPGIGVTDVEVDGEKILTSGLPTRVDINEVRAKAAEQATRLHERLAS
jgi:hypothetical protein